MELTTLKPKDGRAPSAKSKRRKAATFDIFNSSTQCSTPDERRGARAIPNFPKGNYAGTDMAPRAICQVFSVCEKRS